MRSTKKQVALEQAKEDESSDETQGDKTTSNVSLSDAFVYGGHTGDGDVVGGGIVYNCVTSRGVAMDDGVGGTVSDRSNGGDSGHSIFNSCGGDREGDGLNLCGGGVWHCESRGRLLSDGRRPRGQHKRGYSWWRRFSVLTSLFALARMSGDPSRETGPAACLTKAR